MIKRYNFRIYPNAIQENQIQTNFGCCRFVYNYYLAKRMEMYEKDKSNMSFFDCCKDLTALKREDEYNWLYKADSNSLQASLKHLDLAYKAFFRNVKNGGAPGFPKFKSKRETQQSYTCKNHEKAKEIAVGDNKIKLPKLGYVDCRISRQPEGRILHAVVMQVPSGKYYVSICCEAAEPLPLAKTEKSVGLHLGIKDIISLSDGQKIENKKYLEQSQIKLKRLQRSVSRKPKGSQNYEKARIKAARAYERIANQRTDTLHKLSTQIVQSYDTICVREMQIGEMTRDFRFARLLRDASWGKFMAQLSYKAQWYGKNLVYINQFFPSVPVCSSCGYVYDDMRKKRYSYKWDCPKCGTSHDRGINAALNYLKEGTRLNN